MKKILSFLFLTGILLPFSLTAQYDKAARRGTAKAAAELSSMAREVRVSRQVRERMEDYAIIFEYAVKHEQLNASEQRKIQGILNRVEKMLEKSKKSGQMSVDEARTMNRELSKAYRTLWFLRRNKLGKNQKIVFLGRNIVLRDEYRAKFDRGSLNQKEMQEIMHAYYSACRVREQLRTDNLNPKQRLRLERECFEILSEYFTLDQPAETPPAPAKK
ncbi:MAG: hypothetical protein IJH79_08105 [Lentisphaeria bacterium]|nr:hypothetical protein [Lentisphaeria bacterium]